MANVTEKAGKNWDPEMALDRWDALGAILLKLMDRGKMSKVRGQIWPAFAWSQKVRMILMDEYLQLIRAPN